LLKCKNLQSYRADLEVKIPSKNNKRLTEKKENICLKFISQKDTQNWNSQKPHRLLISLRKRLSSLISIEKSKDSTNFVMNAVYDKEKKRFNTKAVQRLYSSLCVIYPNCLKGDVYGILSTMNLNKWDVHLDLELASLSRKDWQKVIEEFLSRKNSKFSIVSSSFSWSDLIEMLNFSQRMLPKYRSCFSLPNFIFSFYSLPDVKQALIDHFSALENKWEKIFLRLEINSLDYFNSDKRCFFEKVLNEMLKEKNLEKYLEIVFDFNLRNAPPKELFSKISKEIITLIREVIRSLKASKRFTLKINAQIDDENDTLFFLNHLTEIPNRINFLGIELNFQELNKDFEDMKLGITSRLKNFGHYSRLRWLAERARKGCWVAWNLRKSLIELGRQKLCENFEILQQKDREFLCKTLIRY